MNNKISRETAKSLVQLIIKENSDNQKFNRTLGLKLKNRVHISKINNIILNCEDSYISLSDSELYWMMKTLNELKKQFKLNFEEIELENPFSIREVNEHELLFIEINEANPTTIVIDGIEEITTDKEYMVIKMPYEKIKEAWDKGIVTYNYATQRTATLKETAMGVIKRPTLFKENVENIKQKMRENKFKSNTITWNILATGDERYEYKDNKLTFTIAEGSQMSVIDGFHRTMAIVELLSENPEIEGHMQLKIWNFDVQEALEYINQEASGTPLTAEKKKTTETSMYMTAVNKINTLGNKDTNVLFNQLGDLNEVIAGLKLASKEIFRDSIEDNYKFSTAREINKFSKYIVDFYNEVFGILGLDLNNIKANKGIKATSHNNIFSLFNFIAIDLYNKENWESILEDLLNSINFDLATNNEWKEVKITSINCDKKTRRLIYSLGTKILKVEMEEVING